MPVRWLQVWVMPDPTSAATSALAENPRFEVVPHSSYSLDLAVWVLAVCHSEETCKLIKGIYFTHNAKVQRATGKWFWKQIEYCFKKHFQCWLSADRVELNEMETMWQNEIWKQSMQSDLHFMFCVVLMPFLWAKIQICWHYFSNILHIMYILVIILFYVFVIIRFISLCNGNLYSFVIVFIPLHNNDFMSTCNKLLAMVSRHPKSLKWNTV